MRDQYNSRRLIKRRFLIAASLLAVTIVTNIFTLSASRAWATDISISIGNTGPLTFNTESGLYSTVTNLQVEAANSYGFSLDMQANSKDLTNQTDRTSKIVGVADSAQTLGVNQWGYGLNIPAASLTTTSHFSPVPTTAKTLLDVSPDKAKPSDCSSVKRCNVPLTYAANLNPATLPTGTYQTTITYTVTAKPAPKPAVPNSICRSGDTKSACKVDLDKNLIPVKYTGNPDRAEWTTIAAPEDTTNPGNWYDYGKKHWANAVTIKPDKLAKYQGKTATLDEADVLGYYTYVPRYAYEVMRRDGTDKPVGPENFNIVFETANTPKKHPAKCTTGANRDYRTACNLDRNYPTTTRTLNSTTWSTHPAFTFGAKELNGIWVGKFETTGDPTDPTILPNQRHLSGNDASWNDRDGINKISNLYTVAKSLGVNDPANSYGGKFVRSVVIRQNSHNLRTLSSRMPTNSDWGAVAYLSASVYGAGHDKVQMNKQNQRHAAYDDDFNTYDSIGTTGCGPSASGNKNTTYKDGETLGAQSACSSSDLQRAYNGRIGQLASTTNNPTGIYDLAGGGVEFVAAATTLDRVSVAANDYFGDDTPRPPYVNLYYNLNNFNACTYDTCGGQALYETNNGHSVDPNAYITPDNQWNGQQADFVNDYAYWFARGGSAAWQDAGIFAANSYLGQVGDNVSMRIILSPAK